MNIVMIGPFGLYPRMTMRVRALPLARALVARGHNVTLLLPPWQNPRDAGHCWIDEGVHIENMPLPTGVPGWFHWRLTAALAHRARTLAPDVVHVFKPKAYAGLAHLALARHLPVVVDADDWEGPGGWNDLSPYPTLLKQFFTWQEHWGLTHAGAVTVASRALQTLVWATGRAVESVFYLPNGFIQRESAPGTKQTVTDTGNVRPTLLLYTRFFEFDLERLWRVVQGVRGHYPDTRLLVIGKGFFEEEKRLLALAREADWSVVETDTLVADTDLVYTGFVPPETLPDYFSQATVALYPFDDTLLNRTKCPVKLMDLLAAGVPVVGEAVGQIVEDIRSGESGILVMPGDEQAFIAAVLKLIDNAVYRRELGNHAIEDMRARFTWGRLVSVAEAAYKYVTY
ncbi:MAG: glycosyltransferase family 4 protein [Anaerolineae bacterium]|nr:glycosyltransferase family 4 protein [Anaerolineae bacterium]